MDMRELELLVPTLFGLEGLCAEELRRLKLPEVAAENGRVRCKAAPADIPRVNLNLRTGERVLLVVGRYRAADFEALFEGCRALPWEDLSPGRGLPGEGALPQLPAPRGARLPGRAEKRRPLPGWGRSTGWKPCRRAGRCIRSSSPSCGTRSP